MLQTRCSGAFSKKLMLNRTFGFQWQTSPIRDVVGLRFVGELKAFADLFDHASNALHQRRQNHWPTLRARTRSGPATFSGEQIPARRSGYCCALGAIGTSKLDVVMKVGIPRSMPCFFGSLKVAITLAFAGSVVSEIIGANSGLAR